MFCPFVNTPPLSPLPLYPQPLSTSSQSLNIWRCDHPVDRPCCFGLSNLLHRAWPSTYEKLPGWISFTLLRPRRLRAVHVPSLRAATRTHAGCNSNQSSTNVRSHTQQLNGSNKVPPSRCLLTTKVAPSHRKTPRQFSPPWFIVSVPVRVRHGRRNCWDEAQLRSYGHGLGGCSAGADTETTKSLFDRIQRTVYWCP